MDAHDDDLFEDTDLFAQDGPDLFAAAAPGPAPARKPSRASAKQPASQLAQSPEPEPLELELESPGQKPSPDVSAKPTDRPALSVPEAAGHATVERPDAPLALYRRYRPDTFAQIIGQEHVTEPLQRALANNKVNHAYLFSGPRGCGKTTSARILARALNCAAGPAPIPCGQCDSCRDLARGGPGSIDVIEIDAASHGLVSDARDLRERAFFAPVRSRYKIYIIDEAHMVSKEGFNALLTVVEEPPPHVKFIFATTEPDKVLPTIRSRTHHYPFRLVPPKTLTAYLATVCESEGVGVEPGVLPLVVRAGAGSVRDSLSVLDQLLGAAGDQGVSYRQAAALLGFTPDALLDEIVDAFAAGDAHGVFGAVDKVIEAGQDPRRFVEDLLRRLRDLIIVAAVPDATSSGLIDVAADQAERLTTQANAMGAGELTRAAEVIAAGLTEMRGTTAPRLHLELMCSRVLLPGADADDRGLHARLERLERRIGMTQTGPIPRLPDGSGQSPTTHPAAPAQAATPQATPIPATPIPAATVPPAAFESVPAAPPASSGPGSRTDPPPEQTRPASASQPDRESAPSAASTPEPITRDQPIPPIQSDGRRTARPDTPVTALDTAEVRRLWPQILEQVKVRRRFTWILLSQNARVSDVHDGLLTIGIANSGARESFERGGSADVLREALVAVLGVPLHIQPIVDVSTDLPPTAGRPASAPEPADPPPASEPTPEPTREPSAPEPSSPPISALADEARRNIRPTRTSPVPEPDFEPAPDDDDAVVDPSTTDDLLITRLGAELIEDDTP